MTRTTCDKCGKERVHGEWYQVEVQRHYFDAQSMQNSMAIKHYPQHIDVCPDCLPRVNQFLFFEPKKP